ncbi:Uncharacterised protein [uncultured archaeon]|nr:Uncharacterised protein [uncultured archaeon]
MDRIIKSLISNPKLIDEYEKKQRQNLVRVQTTTGSTYAGYIKDSDDDGIWFEPLFDDYYPAYIFKTDIKKIIVPTNPEKEKKTLKGRSVISTPIKKLNLECSCMD